MSTSSESGHQGRAAGHMKDGHHLIDGSFPREAHGGHHKGSAHEGASQTHGPNTVSYSTGGMSSGEMSKDSPHVRVASGTL